MERNYTVFVGDVALDEYYEVQRFPAVKEKVGARMLSAQMGAMVATPRQFLHHSAIKPNLSAH